MLNLLSKINNPSNDEFIAEGRWCISALLKNHDFETIGIVRAEGTHSDFEAPPNVVIENHPAEVLSASMGFQFHRGLAAVAKRPIAPSSLPSADFLIACVDLADASNLGAIIRSSAALGAGGLLLPKGRGADVWSRKSIRTSSGAVFRLPIYHFEDLYTTIEQLREMKNYEILGTSLNTDNPSITEPSPMNTNDKRLLIFGSEANGLDSRWCKLCDRTLRIPMQNGVESLNVAACAAIAIYQLGPTCSK